MTEPSPSSTTTATRKPNLRGVSAIRAYFRRNTTPIYFVSPTPFNLLGVDRWISNFHYVNYYDSFDGTHPHVFLPRERGVDDFGSMEEMNNFLLGHPEFAEFAAEQGPGGKAVLVMVDDTTERLAAERGIDVALPPAALRHRLDSKLVTTRLGNEAGVPSVPNVLGRVADYDSLLDLAAHVFEVDYLVDVDTGELYLGELNPRLSGISSMTNVTAGAYAELPLFLFHLLEYLDVDYEIDVDEINARWADPDTVDVWSQVVIKHTGDEVGVIDDAPATGIWRTRRDGDLVFDHADTDWHDLTSGSARTTGFYLRVSGPGDYLYKGADIGILVSRGRLQSDLCDGQAALTPLCRQWIDGIRNRVRATPLPATQIPAVAVATK